MSQGCPELFSSPKWLALQKPMSNSSLTTANDVPSEEMHPRQRFYLTRRLDCIGKNLQACIHTICRREFLTGFEKRNKAKKLKAQEKQRDFDLEISRGRRREVGRV